MNASWPAFIRSRSFANHEGVSLNTLVSTLLAEGIGRRVGSERKGGK